LHGLFLVPSHLFSWLFVELQYLTSQELALCVVVRRRMMEAPPPPPPADAATAVVSAQDMDSSNVLLSPRCISGPSDVTAQPCVSIIRHVSVPCDSSPSSIVAPLSHSLPRPASKISDDKVTVTVKRFFGLVQNYC